MRFSEGMIIEATRCIDDTHALVEGYCWRALVAQDSLDGGLVIDDFHTLRESDCDEGRLPSIVEG